MARWPMGTLRAIAAVVAIVLATSGSLRSKSAASSPPDDPRLASASIDGRGDVAIAGGAKYASIKFEVAGAVQGVSFRRHTKAKAEDLGLMGWCRNTDRGTVEGEYEYDRSASGEGEDGGARGAGAGAVFRKWLCDEGSPRSSVEDCTFSEEVVSDGRRFDDFRIIR